MKKYIFILFLFCFGFVNLYSQWEKCSNGLSYNYVRGITFNGDSIFVGTWGGGVFLSSDNGGTWTPASKGCSDTVDFFFVSKGNIFAGSEYSGLYLSTNNGSSWTQINNGILDMDIDGIAVKDSNVYIGTDGGFYLSTDYGSSFTKHNNGFGNDTLIGCLGLNDTTLFAGCIWVYVSTDNGKTWTQKNKGMNYHFLVNALAFVCNDVYAGVYQGGIYKSTNNGELWIECNKGLTNKLISSIISTGSYIYTSTWGGGVFMSVDNGYSWKEINDGLPSDALSIYCLGMKGDTIYAGTLNGLYKVNWKYFTSTFLIAHINDIIMEQDTSAKVTLTVTNADRTSLIFSYLSDNVTLLPTDSLRTINNCNELSSLITPTRGKAGVANITLKVSNGVDSISTIFKVTVKKVNIDCSVNGIDSTCQNDTITFTTSYDINAAISWRAQNGSIIGSSTDSTVKILWSQPGIWNILLNKTSLLSGRKDSSITPVTINPIPEKPKITKFADTLFSSSANGNQWYFEGNLIPGANNKIYVTKEDGNYTVQVTQKNCVSALSDVFHYVYTGYFDLNISGPETVCQNDTINYRTSSENNVTINWRVDNGVIIGSKTDSTLKVLWDSVGFGNVFLIKENTTLGKKDSNYTPVSIYQVPAKPVITRNVNMLISSSAQGNQWYRNGNPISGATKSTYNATQNGIYTVQVTSSNGCHSLFSDNFDFTYLYFDLTITGSQSACQNDTLNYSTPVENNTTIKWEVNNGTIIDRADSSTLSVNWINTGSGNIKLTKENASLGKKDSSSIDITISEIPPAAKITQNLDTLYSSAPQGNQWYRNGVLIPGATEQIYITKINAKYSVRVTLNFCASPMSSDYNFIAGVEEQLNTDQFTIIPNPANDKLYISTKSGNILGSIEIYSVLGIKVYSGEFAGDKAEIDVSAVPAGLYLIKVGKYRQIFVKE